MKETNLGYHFPGMKKLGYEEPRLLSFFDIADRSPTDFFTDLRIKKTYVTLKRGDRRVRIFSAHNNWWVTPEVSLPLPYQRSANVF